MALHMLSSREVQVARDGDHADGGGLVLRIRGRRASWLLRYTGLDGRRRDMGLGAAHRDSMATAGESLARARTRARRELDSLAAGAFRCTSVCRSPGVRRRASAAARHRGEGAGAGR
jgi:Arm domain-containing DNA-binding protein